MSQAISWFPLDQIARLEEALLSQLDSRRNTTRRDALACCLGLSGLRSGEVSQLVVSDLSVPLRRLRVRTIKGGPERTLSLDASLVQELLDWRDRCRGQMRLGFAKRQPGDLLLPNCHGKPVRREQFNRMAKRLFTSLLGDYHGLTFHSLRHTFAMRAYADTKDLFLVQRQLGHASIQTTEIYARSLAELPESCRVTLDPDKLRGRLRERLSVVNFEEKVG